jgi:phosphoribosylformylglycinamidine synthase
MRPRALILHATGTNRDLDASAALELAGAAPEIVPLNLLQSGQKSWSDYQLLVLPGGFSYADALGAGRLFALDLQVYFAEHIHRFVDSGKPVLGICNGFQALVKAGILPGFQPEAGGPAATLTFNASGHFECRWVTLAAASQICLWTRDLEEAIYCPVAHGEGRFIASSPQALEQIRHRGQIALVYARSDGSPAQGAYPDNPNGSAVDIAGVCNPAGNVLGLMPHPENHIHACQHPRWTRRERGRMGLPLFVNGVRHAA